MEFADYKRVIDSNQSLTRTIYGVRSFNQQILTTWDGQIVLIFFYDKMKMLDTINCEPFGYSKEKVSITDNMDDIEGQVREYGAIDAEVEACADKVTRRVYCGKREEAFLIKRIWA